MIQKTSLIVTSISAPNDVLKALANGAVNNYVEFILVGDTPSPIDFQLEGCQFYGMKEQAELEFTLAKTLPERHYGRKNLGYLIAIQNGSEIIIETDDDNYPKESFWNEKNLWHTAHILEDESWVNVYKYFSDKFIWPRGFSLEHLQAQTPELDSLKKNINCPVQQGLADDNPDVDAIYRLAYPLPLVFKKDVKIAVGKNSWCPFNSQNTVWFKQAFPLMYLPSYCSFRMTDIWRSFVVQRIMWENDWHLLFYGPTVWQNRNEHDLIKDFADEIPGYLNNHKISEELAKLNMERGVSEIPENMKKAYQKLVQMGLVDQNELGLLEAWLVNF